MLNEAELELLDSQSLFVKDLSEYSPSPLIPSTPQSILGAKRRRVRVLNHYSNDLRRIFGVEA